MNTFSPLIRISFPVSLLVGACLLMFPMFLSHLSFKFGYITSFILLFVVSGFLVALPPASARLAELVSDLRWWHLAWLLVFLSGLVFRVRDVATIQRNAIDFWALYRLMLMGIVLFVLIARLASGKTNWVRPITHGVIGLLALHTLFNLMSTAWSIFPLWTLYKSFEYLIDVALVGAIVVSVKNIRELKSLFDANWLLLSAVAVSVWLGILIWPEESVSRGVGLLNIQISGVLPEVAANSVGEIGAILAIVALCRIFTNRQHSGFYALILFGALVTLIFSQTRSSWASLLVGIAFALLSARRIGILLFFLVLAAAILSTNIGELLWQVVLRGQQVEQLMALSGRAHWWDAGRQFFLENPLGAGAYAAGRFGVLADLGATTTSTIHNTWLEALLGVGLPGLLPLLACFVWTWIILLKRSDTGQRLARPSIHYEAIGVLAILSVRSMFTSHLIWHPPLTFFLVLTYATFLHRSNLRDTGFRSEGA